MGRAVRRLREDLGLSQEGLVEEVGNSLDATMISRWERGFCSPSPGWRKRLASLARRRGCHEAAAAFEEPLREWKSVILTPEDRRLLALCEIVVLNKPQAPDQWPEVLPWKIYEHLVQSLEDAAAYLKQNQGRKFPPLPGRWGATTLTDEQRTVWMKETSPRGKKAIPERDPGTQADDVVVQYADGRVEVRKDAKKEPPRGRTTSEG